jgi:hypothetical protein
MKLFRVLAAVLLLTPALPNAAEQAKADAGLTCEQLYAAAKSAVQYRDEGYSLSQVLAALKSVQSEGKLTAAEIETLRKAITFAYLSTAWPEEIALECKRTKEKR